MRGCFFVWLVGWFCLVLIFVFFFVVVFMIEFSFLVLTGF